MQAANKCEIYKDWLVSVFGNFNNTTVMVIAYLSQQQRLNTECIFAADIFN